MAAESVVVLDNGAGSIKAGFAGESTPRRVVPHCLATLPKQLRVLVANETEDLIKNKSQLKYARPFDRGYCINWEQERVIWRHIWQLLEVADPAQHGLVVTEPPLTPAALRREMNELVFEAFGFASYFRTTPQHLAAYHLRHDAEAAPPPCMLVLDSGYSFSHAVPVVGGRLLAPATQRVDVGGKLMTNYLKEIVSYRAYNMMQETHLMNEVKHGVCFCSLDLMQDLSHPRGEALRGMAREYVLPDYKTTMKGEVRMPKAGGPSHHEQVLELTSERVGVPELLFHPQDIGLNQGGVHHAIARAISCTDRHMHSLMYKNVRVVGGNSLFPNFAQRLRNELRMVAPDHLPIQVTSAVYKRVSITKAEWDEHGHSICLRKWGKKGGVQLGSGAKARASAPQPAAEEEKVAAAGATAGVGVAGGGGAADGGGAGLGKGLALMATEVAVDAG